MKKLIIMILFINPLFSFSTNDPQNIPEKSLNTFEQMFKNAENVTWINNKLFTNVSFNINGQLAKATFDHSGNLIQVLKYYKAKDLAPFIYYKIVERYPQRAIFGITEVSDKNGIVYVIVLKDEKNWYYMKVDQYAEMTLMKKFKRGEIRA